MGRKRGEDTAPRAEAWLQWCPSCQRKHYVTMQECPECRMYAVPRPASSNVADNCGASYRCDGCEAYDEHLR